MRVGPGSAADALRLDHRRAGVVASASSRSLERKKLIAETLPFASVSGYFSSAPHYLIFANFWQARSRLYQNEILQESMRLKALAEIYIMHSFAPLSILKISSTLKIRIFQSNFSCKHCQTVVEFSPNL